MGIPLYKPKHSSECVKQDISETEEWSMFPPHSNYRQEHYHHNNSFTSYLSASNNTTLRRSRMSRRHSMLTSSLMDRRRNSRTHSSVTSLPMRSRLDRRLQQRIQEKEDLLEQLELTVSLLDQFISARMTLGDDMIPLPPFMIRDLPAVLETAASLAALTQSSLNNTQQHPSDTTTLHDMVELLLQVPPYSTRIVFIENSIISSHQRIREQLSQLGSSFNIPSPNHRNRTVDSIPSSSSSTTNTAARTTIFPLLDDTFIPPS